MFHIASCTSPLVVPCYYLLIALAHTATSVGTKVVGAEVDHDTSEMPM